MPKVDVCLACKAISFRPIGAPPPERCPRCHAELPRIDARTGRWEPQRRRRLVAVDGDPLGWA